MQYLCCTENNPYEWQNCFEKEELQKKLSNVEIKTVPGLLYKHTAIWLIGITIQTLKRLLLGNLENGTILKECFYRAV